MEFDDLDHATMTASHPTTTEEWDDQNCEAVTSHSSANGSVSTTGPIMDPEKVQRQAIVEDQPGPPSPGSDAAQEIEKPRSWPERRKGLYCYMLNYLAFTTTFASSLYSPAILSVSQDFNVSEILATLPFSIYILGSAFGPMIASPLSEHFGRKPVLLAGMVASCLFTLGAGFTDNIAALTICRFFAGVFFSPPLGIAAAAMADVYTPAERSIPLSVCGGVAFLGPAVAPLVGGYVVSTYGWRWTQWLVLVFMAPCFLYAFMRESHLPVLEKRHERKNSHDHEKVQDAAVSRVSTARRTLLKTLVRPSMMLVKEPVVAAFSLYIGFNFGLNYAFFAAYTYVFRTTYGLDLTSIGLTFTGLAVGVILGTLALVGVNKLIYMRKMVKARRAGGPDARLPPEERLYGALIGSPAIVMSLFMFAWTARPEVSYYVPIVAEGFFGFGNVLVYSSTSQYLVDLFGAERGASATAANTLVRYLFGFSFPLFTTQIYAALGTQWAGSLFGFIALALACIPWLMFKFGPWLRRSRS